MINRFDNKNMTDFFPFPSYRQHQRETIDKIQELISVKNVKNILLEMPTGSGKSPVAISAGLWSENSYCLTSQKILQDQYIRDFIDKEGYVSVLKGRGNYECNFLGSPAMCNECYEPARKKCYKDGSCLYQNIKRRTALSNVALMNYAYFLNVIECDPSELFKPRKLLICDEAHNVETEIMGQTEFLLSEFMFKRVGHVTNIPTYDEITDYQRWMEDNIDFIQKILSQKDDDLKTLNLKRMRQDRESSLFLKLSTEASELTSQIEELDRLVRRTKLFLSTLKTVEWVFTVEKTEKLKMKKVIFRPLTIDTFAEDALLKFGEHRLYMSATILDSKSFCKSLGINHDESVFIRVPSTFPVQNRKIFFTNTGYMNINNIDETLPKIATDIKRALDYHKLEKGIIHCVDEYSQITTDKGRTLIKNIKSGISVKTLNESTSEFEFKKVKQLIYQGEKECLKLKFATTEIVCTLDHLFLTRNRSWVKAIDLNENDDIVSEWNENSKND